jgi:hypothetical protein
MVRASVVVFCVLLAAASMADAQSDAYQWVRRAAHPTSGSLFVFDEARGVPVMLEPHFEGAGRRIVTYEWYGDRWCERTDAVLPEVFKADVTWSWIVVRPFTATFDPSTNKVLVFGHDLQSVGKTYLYDGSSWSLAATGGPSPRVNFGLGSDFTNARTVLFGGNTIGGSGSLLSDTWLWNGTAWSQASNSSAPGARSMVDLVFDPATGRVAMFGGSNASGFAGLTTIHEWNGVTWNSVSVPPPSNVQPRRVASRPGDPGCYVLFDAQGVGTPALHRWNGSGWTLEFSAGLAGRESFVVPDADQLLFVDSPAAQTFRTRSFQRSTSQWSTLHEAGVPSGLWTFTTVEPQDALILRRTGYPSSMCEFWRFDHDGTLTHLLTAPQSASNPTLMAYHPPSGYVVDVNPYSGETSSFTGTALVAGGTLPNASGFRFLAGFHPPSGMVLALTMDAANHLQIWGYAPHSWTLLATGPVMADIPIGAYDGARGRLVFCDRDGTVCGEWDGAAFHAVPAPPAGSFGYMMRPHPDGGVAWFQRASSQWTAIHRWDGVAWTTASIANPRATPWQGNLHYDIARRRWVMFHGEIYDLESTALTSDARAPLPGATVTYTFDRPASAGRPYLVALSTSTEPAIPWRLAPTYGTEVIPIANDWLLDASLGLGLFGVLDAQGQGQQQLTIPNVPLAGFRAHAVGITVGAGGALEFVSAPVPLTIRK